MSPWLADLIEILTALLLVVINGFFVAAEFALVKVRPGQVDQLVSQGRPFSRSAAWLVARLEPSLSACQLGITMASLALGWVGEPAFAHLMQPVLQSLGIQSEAVLHTLAFIIAFTTITALHLVVGEQAPKIFAIRRPEVMLLWCAAPMRLFYVFSYPLLALLNRTTSVLLAQFGLESTGEHGEPVSEAELRLMIRESHRHGHITRAEHSLINAVFEFDDIVCRRIMVPRNDVEYFDLNDSLADFIELARRTRHTRFPVCDGSLDDVRGIIHVKDLVGIAPDSRISLSALIRPPKKVPENMPVSKLLRHFQATHQLMAFVIDEYGMVIGIVTLENVLEEIIGDVDDEFDERQLDIVAMGPDTWIVLGSTPIEDVCEELNLAPTDADVDTFAGLLMHMGERILNSGEELTVGDFRAEVLETRDDRPYRIRMTRRPSPDSVTPPTGVASENNPLAK
ncbi:MAG: HlyC/CorC family transporter [Planctomycetaceae bacterium]|nr:HlyC/CorC family transporter [Planctomycetaceae bacterium]